MKRTVVDRWRGVACAIRVRHSERGGVRKRARPASEGEAREKVRQAELRECEVVRGRGRGG